MVTRSSSSDMFAVFLGELVGVEWVAEWRRAGLLAGVCDRALSRSSTTKEEAGCTCHMQAKLRCLASCDSKSRTGAGYTIDLNPQTLSTDNSTHNVVHSCLQHAQAARHARIPRSAAREGPAPPGLSQDEDARSRKCSENCLLVLYTDTFAERGALRLVISSTAKRCQIRRN
jgi:hypothetical protein